MVPARGLSQGGAHAARFLPRHSLEGGYPGAHLRMGGRQLCPHLDERSRYEISAEKCNLFVTRHRIESRKQPFWGAPKFSNCMQMEVAMKIFAVSLFAVLLLLSGAELHSADLPIAAVVRVPNPEDTDGISKGINGISNEHSIRNPDIVMPQKGIPAPGQAPSPAVEPGDSFRPGPSPAMQNPQMKNLPRGQRSQDLGGVIPPDMDDKNR
jgi:hypothetical protein